MPILWSQYNLLSHIFRIISRLSKPKLTFSNFPHYRHSHVYFPHNGVLRKNAVCVKFVGKAPLGLCRLLFAGSAGLLFACGEQEGRLCF